MKQYRINETYWISYEPTTGWADLFCNFNFITNSYSSSLVYSYNIVSRTFHSQKDIEKSLLFEFFYLLNKKILIF